MSAGRMLGAMLRRWVTGEMRRRGAGRAPILIAGAAAALGAGWLLGGGPSGETEGGDGATRAPEIARAQADRDRDDRDRTARPSGDFDYYLLALSWSPTYCRGRPDADQCGRGRRFIVHGLWPQYERGWPRNCATAFAPPTGAVLRRYAVISGGVGLLKHQWRAHGTCSGLSPGAYFDAMARATAAITIPDAFRSGGARRLTPRAIEQAFLVDNPKLVADGVTVKCDEDRRRLREVRICFDKDLTPRACGPDAVRDCRSGALEAPAPR